MDKTKAVEFLRSLGSRVLDKEDRLGMLAQPVLGGAAGNVIGAGVDYLIPGEGETFQNIGTGLGFGAGDYLIQFAANKMRQRPNSKYQQLELNLTP
jgi:hypothetical protein